MAKTNPIGVRFDEDLLSELKVKKIAESPQRALNLYEETYRNRLIKKDNQEREGVKTEKENDYVEEDEIYSEPLDFSKLPANEESILRLEMRECKDGESLTKVVGRIKKSELHWKIRMSLEAEANELSKNFYFD